MIQLVLLINSFWIDGSIFTMSYWEVKLRCWEIQQSKSTRETISQVGKQVALSLVVNVPTGGGVIYAGASVRSEY